MPGSRTASVECTLINCTACCLADLNRIWCSYCTVRNKFGYHSSLPCYDRYFCPWNINGFSCFTLYPLTVKRTWIRSHEIFTLLFNINLVPQINPPQLSWSALALTYRPNPTAIISIRTITNIRIGLQCHHHFLASFGGQKM